MSFLFEIVASPAVYTTYTQETLSNEEIRNSKNSRKHVHCDP